MKSKMIINDISRDIISDSIVSSAISSQFLRKKTCMKALNGLL